MTGLLWLPLLVLFGAQDQLPFGFSGIELYKAGAQARCLITADFNGDGHLDFALANNERSRIEIFLQKSPSEVTAPDKKKAHYDDVNEIHDDARFRKVTIPLESTVHAMIAADLESDGKPELVVRGTPSRLTVWKQHEPDQWTKAQKLKIKQGMGPRQSLLATDLNGDGRPDLIMLGKESIKVFLQSEAGRLQPPETFPTALRDATGMNLVRPKDAPPVLVMFRLGNDDGMAVRPLLGKSLGPEWILRTGKMKSAYLPPETDHVSVIAVMSVSNRLHLKAIRKGDNKDSVFETPIALYPQPPERGVNERGVIAGDVDGDGLTDVVVSRPSASNLCVYLQDKNGYFRAPRTSSTFADTIASQIGDLDGDGKLEVLVVSAEEQVVGLAAWEGERLAFPKRVGGITGKPLAAIGIALEKPDRLDLAVVTEEKRKYALQVLSGFQGEARTIKLDFLKRKPTRLLAVDIDGDGDQDLAVVTDRDDLALVLNEGGGKLTALGSEAFGGRWLLKDADTRTFTVTRLADGREAILVAKKTMGRAVALDENRKLVIVEQFGAGENTKLIGVARSGDEMVVVDERAGELVVLRKSDGEWKRVQDIDLPTSIVRSVRAVAFRPGGATDLLVAERSGFIVVRRGTHEAKVESMWSYESQVKGARLWRIAEGDLNQDGKRDLVVTDNEKRSLEILVTPVGGIGAVKRALRFEIFQEQTGYRGRSNTVREMVIADVTGDKKNDLLFLLHDRVVLYPQE